MPAVFFFQNGTAKKYLRSASNCSFYNDLLRVSDSVFLSAAEAHYDRVTGMRDVVIDVWSNTD